MYKKEPIGLFGSFNPTLPLRIAFDTALTASSCPTTRSCKIPSKFLRRSRYLNDRFLPDKAIDLIDEASSRVRLGIYSAPKELKEIEEELEKLEQEKENAIVSLKKVLIY